MKKKLSMVIVSTLLLGYLAPFSTLAVAEETTVPEDLTTKSEKTEGKTPDIENNSDNEVTEEPVEKEAEKPTETKEVEPVTPKIETKTEKPKSNKSNLKTAIPAGSTYNSLFPDDNLAKKIAVIVTGNADATGDEVADSVGLLSITQLNLSGETGNDETDIASIEGFQYLENVTSVDLSENNLTDITPLADLTKIVTLNFSSNLNLEDLNGVEGLINLQELNISNCKSLTNISPVATLPALKEIGAQGCNIQTLELENPAGDVLPELETFYLQENDLQDLTVLATLPKLENLYIKGNSSLESLETLNGSTSIHLIDASNCTDMETVGDISGMTNLEMIQLSGCSKLKEITDLKNLPNLTNITADNCIIEDLGTLENLPKLQTLILSGNEKLTNIDAVSDLPQLKTVALDGCGITSIGTFDNLPKLEKIDIKGNSVTDISAITDLPRLSYLDASENQITTIGTLAKLPLLEWLDLSDNQLIDVNAISNFPSLNYIDVSNNSITNFGEMTELPSLKEFYGQFNKATDISMFHDMPNLRKLNVSNNLINNLGTFENLPKLQNLDIHSNKITNTTVIHDLPSLETYDASSNVISTLGTMDNLPEVTTINLSSNRIPSLEPIGDLPKLDTLLVNSNSSYLRTVGSLDGLPALRILELNSNYINFTGKEATLSAFSDLTNLTELSMKDNFYIVDLSGLSSLTNLRYLYLDNNRIEDVTPLSNLTELRELTLGTNKIQDISALSSLNKLENLVVKSNKIIDISPVAEIIENGAIVTATSQTRSLPSVLTYQGTFTIEDPVIWYDGTILPPSSIASSGVYNDGKITWDKKTSPSSSTSFSFNKVEEGLTFSGTVTQPYKASVKVTANAEQTYTIGDTVSEEQFLLDVKAKSADGAPVTSDFETVVDLNTFGDYEVTLTSEKNGVQADSCKVIVHVLHGAPIISADETISYDKNATVTEAEFLADIHASTDLDTEITSDFSTAVDFSQGGEYTVALNSENADGVKSDTVYVKVTVNKDPAPVISSKNEYTYDKFSEVTEAQFLDDIDANTDDGSIVTSNFGTAVNLDKAGDYTVTLNSSNSDAVVATPTVVTVHVEKEVTATINADQAQQYDKHAVIDEAQFLEDVDATIDATPTTAVITSDFESVVDLNVPGTYTVTLNATNEDGGASTPKEVSVVVRKLPAPEITADAEITYPKFDEVSEAEFLSDIHATISDPNVTITTNFNSIVKLDKAGDYTVMLNAENEDGVKATPVEVIVHIEQGERPVITADTAISYDKFSSKTEAEFLSDIHATTSDGQASTVITSNFTVATNFNTAMAYTVTLNATNEDGISAEPVLVTVTINQEKAATLKADSEVTYAKKQQVTEAEFFKNIHLEGTEAPSTAEPTSDFETAVDFSNAGDYTVTINATNEDGAASTPIEVVVHIGQSSAPVITAKTEVEYRKHEVTDERRFLYDSEAKTNEEDAEIKTDFSEKVDVDSVGTYKVTLTATNEDGLEASPVEVNVVIHDMAAEKATVKYLDENGTEIAPSETLTGNLDDTFSIQAKAIDGYKCDATLSGVFTTSEQTVTFHYQTIKPGAVTIKYKDANGKSVAEDKEITGEVGDDFEAVAQTISGYSCQATASGKVTEEPQTITFTYNKVSPSKSTGKITVNYLDESGKKLADSKTITGNIDDPYNVDAKAINGYQVVGDDSATGVFKNDTQTINFKYKKNVTIKNDPTQKDNGPSNTKVKNNSNVSIKETTGKEKLPATGDTETVTWIFLIGLVFLIISSFLLFKRPKNS
ncbi:LapB repeat-containing protein [Listeria seeligeri]|uniref:LapB repeat-containing protein n=1 Tax=Listeria seeligeri TaxID=1640 RepID=UPI0016288937|nr:LapB repeat-containing protein [Listeria seeligeri]MBC1719691.1 LapB repeat-containing protein [Listeria seeligeri]MBC1857228.1 LapB repeat-containing protein [Listeria seeligeri]